MHQFDTSIKGHFIVISLDCESGQADVIDSLNASDGNFKSGYFCSDAVEKMLKAFLQVVCFLNDKPRPSLKVKQQKLTRTQGSMDCGPCSLLYFAALLELDSSLMARLTYTDEQIKKLRRVHARITEIGWFNHLNIR